MDYADLGKAHRPRSVMAEINRCALVVRPRKPLVDWSNKIDPEFPTTLASAREDPTLYLVPAWAAEDLDGALEELWEGIFEEELVGWYTDEALWPKRSLEVFRQWFDVEVCSTIVDLDDEEPLELEG
jgi:hypothetical protein